MVYVFSVRDGDFSYIALPETRYFFILKELVDRTYEGKTRHTWNKIKRLGLN